MQGRLDRFLSPRDHRAAMRSVARLLFASAASILLLSFAATAGSTSHSSTDGKIVFSLGDINVGTAIWTVRDDGSELTQVTHPPKAGRDNQPVWSPDRRRIAFVREVVAGTDFRGDYIRHDHLTVMNADGSAIRRLGVRRHNPAWSPGGGRIAFVQGYNEDGEIWTIRPNGTGARRLTTGENPAWSPDGRQIAFERYTGDRYETFVMNASGNGLRKLVPLFKDDNASPDWSPDGRQIAFTGCRCEPGVLRLAIYVVDRGGSNLRRLAGGVASKDASGARWAPDGSRVLFEREQGDADSTFAIKPSGGQPKRIAMHTDYPVWSPDARSIAFARDGSSLRVVPATGGPAKLIARGDARDIDW